MREVEIERLLQWAYRDELPKRGIGTLANRWDHVTDYGERGGTTIDDEPGFPAAMGVPHVDAVTIARAVDGLNDQVELPWSEYRWLLLGDVYGIAPSDDPLAGRVFSESALVASFARMGEHPRWSVGIPQPQAVTHKGVVLLQGESKGRDERGRPRYTEGSHCFVRYVSPTVDTVVFRRAEYVVWYGALMRLAGILRAWTLTDHVALKPTAPGLPWLDDCARQASELPITTSAWPMWADSLKLKPKRKRAMRSRPEPAALVP